MRQFLLNLLRNIEDRLISDELSEEDAYTQRMLLHLQAKLGEKFILAENAEIMGFCLDDGYAEFSPSKLLAAVPKTDDPNGDFILLTQVFFSMGSNLTNEQYD